MVSTLITWHLEMLSMIEDMIKLIPSCCFLSTFVVAKASKRSSIGATTKSLQLYQIPFLNRMKLHATVSNWSSEKTAGKLRLTLIKECIFYARLDFFQLSSC